MIEVQNLQKKYENIIAVNDVSFKVDKGRTFGLLGPNGAGKTTTIKLLCGIIKPDSGTVSLNGRTEQSAGGAGWAIIMIMAMLGGGMMPLYFMPVWLRPFSNISPVKWRIYALEGAIWRNFTIIEMAKPCLILIMIGAASFLFGVFILSKQQE